VPPLLPASRGTHVSNVSHLSAQTDESGGVVTGATHESVRQLLIDAGLRVLLLVVVLGIGRFLGRPSTHVP
jgi:hypothetical protein